MPAAVQGSYRLKELDATGAERARLEEQARFILEEEIRLLNTFGAAAGARILDLGCGTGQLTRALAKQAGPDGEVMGVDADPGIFPRHNTQPGLSFSCHRAGALPKSLGTFDLIYARFLFQHLPDPVGALRNAASLLAPGGKIVIVDSDDGLILTHPLKPELDTMLETARTRQAAKGGDRYVGRKLPRMMNTAGLSLDTFQTRTFSSATTPFPLLFRMAMGYKASLVQRKNELEGLCTALEKETQENRFFFMTGVCVAVGSRGG